MTALKDSRFSLDTRRKFFTVRLVRNREVFSPQKCPSLGSVQAHVGWGLGQPGLVKGPLPTAGEVDGLLIAQAIL